MLLCDRQDYLFWECVLGNWLPFHHHCFWSPHFQFLQDFLTNTLDEVLLILVCGIVQYLRLVSWQFLIYWFGCFHWLSVKVAGRLNPIQWCTVHYNRSRLTAHSGSRHVLRFMRRFSFISASSGKFTLTVGTNVYPSFFKIFSRWWPETSVYSRPENMLIINGSVQP